MTIDATAAREFAQGLGRAAGRLYLLKRGPQGTAEGRQWVVPRSLRA